MSHKDHRIAAALALTIGAVSPCAHAQLAGGPPTASAPVSGAEAT